MAWLSIAGTSTGHPSVAAVPEDSTCGPTAQLEDDDCTVAGVWADTAAASEADSSVCVVFFYSPRCPHCDRVEEYFADAEAQLRVKKYNASTHISLWKEYLSSYEVPQSEWGSVPTVFVGDEAAVGDRASIRLIEQYLQANRAVSCPTLPHEDSTPTDTAAGPAIDTIRQSGGTQSVAKETGAPKAPVREGASLTLVSVLNLALVDAINPCALAVLVILLTSILGQDPTQTRRTLWAGLSFAAAVLLAYLVMGVLLVLGITSLIRITTIEIPFLYRLFGVVAILLGVLQLKDWWKYGAFGFVTEVPFSWRPRMKSVIQKATGPAGAFVAGIVVSLFLLPCTSGPYFVAGGLLAPLPLADALPWLAFYNLVFVAPMVVITLVVSGGFLSVQQVSQWRQRQIERLHLFAGLILIALGIALVAGLL